MRTVLAVLALLFTLASTNASGARLWMSGWELNTTTASVEWTAVLAGSTVSTTNVHAGTYAGRSLTAAAAVTGFTFNVPAIGASDVWTVRTWIYIVDTPDTAAWVLMMWQSSVDLGVAVRLNTDRTFNLVYQPTASNVVGSASSAIALNEWHLIEVQASRVDSTCEARLDAVSFASGDCGTGFEGNVNRIGVGFNTAVGTGVANADVYFDDFAYNNQAGAVQTSWPGPGYIVHLRPNGEGDADVNVTGTCGGGTAYECLDEVTPDDATTATALTSNTSTLDVDIENPSLPDSDDIIVVVGLGARFVGGDLCVASATTTNYRARIKSQAAGTVAPGALINIASAAYVTHGDTVGSAEVFYNLMQYTDPQAGGAWTQALLNTTQIGAATTDGAPDLCVSTLWAAVEYIPQAASACPGGRMSLLGIGCDEGQK